MIVAKLKKFVHTYDLSQLFENIFSALVIAFVAVLFASIPASVGLVTDDILALNILAVMYFYSISGLITLYTIFFAVIFTIQCYRNNLL